MQKCLYQLKRSILFAVCLLISTTAFAKAILNIVPATSALVLSPTGTATITYTVTNDTQHLVNDLIINPTYHTTGNTAGISLQSNQCAGVTLAPNASCTFNVLLNGLNQPADFVLRPRVCAYSGTVCSVPTAQNEVQISVSHGAAPTVTSASPTGTVSANTSDIVLTFSAAMNPATISSSTVTLVRGTTTSNLISTCTPSADDTVFTCSFNTALSSNHTYHITVSTGAESQLGAPLATAYTASFATLARFVYVTNYGNNTLSVCPINLDGSLGLCTAANPGNTFHGPANLSINAVGSLAYVANFNNNTVSICPLNADGTLGTPCTSSPDATFNGPAGVAINKAETYVYVVNYNANSISTCPIQVNGTLGPCTSSNPGTTLMTPDCIVLSSGSRFAYVTNTTDSSVSVCPIDASGTIGTCTRSPDPTFFGPAGFAFDSGDRFGYVANGQAPHQTVSQCPINADGTIGTCIALNSVTFNGNNFGKIALNNRISYAYVANQSNNWISICPVNANGSFGTCITSNPGATFNSPEGVFVH